MELYCYANLYQGRTKIEHYRIRKDKMLTLFNFFATFVLIPYYTPACPYHIRASEVYPRVPEAPRRARFPRGS